jgi:DNA-binding response OmpR family regulator
MTHAPALSELFAAGFDAESVERIRAVLDRTLVDAEPLVAGPIRIDPRTRRVTVAGRRVLLAQKEYELLCALARDPDRVFTKQELLRSVWGYRSASRTLDSHASRLRKKLCGAAPDLRLVVNVWGVGYRLLE